MGGAEEGETAVDLRLEGSLRLLEGSGHLGERQPVDVPQDDGDPVAHGQSREQDRPVVDALALLHRRDRFVGSGIAGQTLLERPAVRTWLVERRRTWLAPPGHAVSREIEDDGRKPRPKAEGADPIGRVRLEGPVCPDQRILRDLLRVTRIADHAQGDRVEPVLVCHDECLEGGVEISGQPDRQVIVHRHHVTPMSSPRLHQVGGGPVRQSAAMRDDDRFDEFIAILAGFHRAWLVYLGLELGLFARLDAAGVQGLTAAELADETGTRPEPVDVWAWAAEAHGLVDAVDGRLLLDPAVAAILLHDARPEYLGGQIVHTVVASMDWDGLADFFRTGVPRRDRPDRYRAAIERLTVQDIAVFFQEVLASVPQLVADLARGGRVLDVHCGGGRWLIAVARRFAGVNGVGVEFEADSVARARANVLAAGLERRITIEHGDVTAPGRGGEFDLAYFQYALHQLPDPVASLREAWAAVRPGGRLIVLDWPLPSSEEDQRSRHGELIAGIQLDEVYSGTRLATREQFLAWFAEAGLPATQVLELPSGASAFLVERAAATR